MLTRLEIRGFKNLLDVDVRFGPLTCIAGRNGVGKSNLFDAILFLSALADKPVAEAVGAIRGGESFGGLFAAHGNKKMFLAAEMLVLPDGVDEFGQRAEASNTFVRYELELGLQDGPGDVREGIRLEREELSYIKKAEGKKALAFDHDQEWFDSVVKGSRRGKHFISTNSERGIVRLHWDRKGEGGGRPPEFRLENLPRTALSSARNVDECRTAVLVRQEMRNWRLLQLEPSALRRPDDFQGPDRVAVTGAHIAATLYRLACGRGEQGHEEQVYTVTANRLAELVEGVRSIRVDRDDTRRVFRLMMTDRYGLELPATGLSDGAMRFIALTVLQQDPTESGLICLEEPENGIHPERAEVMLDLLYDIAADSQSPVDDDRPLRQVIVNTHAPVIAALVRTDDLLFASLRSKLVQRRRVPGLGFACMESTWRAEKGMITIPKGKLISYLKGGSSEPRPEVKRVIDRVSEQLAPEVDFGLRG